MIVAMIWCETKTGGGYEKGVCIIEEDKDLTCSVTGV